MLRHELSRRVETDPGPCILGNNSRMRTAANAARLQIRSCSTFGHAGVLVGSLEIHALEHHARLRALRFIAIFADGAEIAPVDRGVSRLDTPAAACPERHSAEVREPTVLDSDACALGGNYAAVVVAQLNRLVLLLYLVPVVRDAQKRNIAERQLRARALDPEHAAVVFFAAADAGFVRSANPGGFAVSAVLELAARRPPRAVI
mmetsp:Transcript_1427/g.4213  ORF Transcript_1427/g.4213 Transcript_1427/m.4213 type:complete len:204 (+) Transcript_1427:324-935(+)